MKQPLDNVPLKYLMTGECLIAESPTVVSTVLGSCLAVTMYYPAFKIGAVCHAFMPECPKEERSNVCEENCKYVDMAVYFMLNRLYVKGIPKNELEIKIFGGSDRLGGSNGYSVMGVGRHNIKMAEDILKEEGLNIQASDVGGERGRKLIFATHTGGAWIKKLNPLEK